MGVAGAAAHLGGRPSGESHPDFKHGKENALETEAQIVLLKFAPIVSKADYISVISVQL